MRIKQKSIGRALVGARDSFRLSRAPSCYASQRPKNRKQKLTATHPMAANVNRTGGQNNSGAALALLCIALRTSHGDTYKWPAILKSRSVSFPNVLILPGHLGFRFRKSRAYLPDYSHVRSSPLRSYFAIRRYDQQTSKNSRQPDDSISEESALKREVGLDFNLQPGILQNRKSQNQR